MCSNPDLAGERRRKRKRAAAATEKDLVRVQAAVQRLRKSLHGKDAIGLKVGAMFGKRKMAKHFHLAITDISFEFTRIEDAIAEEALLEGFYVLRTNVAAESLAAAKVKAHPERGAFSILVFSQPATVLTKPTLLLDHGLAVLAVGDVLHRYRTIYVGRAIIARAARFATPETAAAVRFERGRAIFRRIDSSRVVENSRMSERLGRLGPKCLSDAHKRGYKGIARLRRIS